MASDAEVSGQRTVSGYSGRAVKPIALRFVLELAKSELMKGMTLSGIGGIETWRDALEFIQLGCSNVQVCTAVYPLIDHERCIGCGRCELSCNDGGHQAIVFDRATRQPRIVGTKCVGCYLCRLVCPIGAIHLSKRVKK